MHSLARATAGKGCLSGRGKAARVRPFPRLLLCLTLLFSRTDVGEQEIMLAFRYAFVLLLLRLSFDFFHPFLGFPAPSSLVLLLFCFGLSVSSRSLFSVLPSPLFVCGFPPPFLLRAKPYLSPCKTIRFGHRNHTFWAAKGNVLQYGGCGRCGQGRLQGFARAVLGLPRAAWWGRESVFVGWFARRGGVAGTAWQRTGGGEKRA